MKPLHILLSLFGSLFILGVLGIVFAFNDRSGCENPGSQGPDSLSGEYFEIILDSRANSLKIGEPVFLIIKGQVSNQIRFPSEGNIRIYELDACGNEIREQLDLVNRTFSHNWTLTSEGELGIETVFPDTTSSESPLHLRIYVYGYFLIEGNPNEKEIFESVDFYLY
ncbi:MAG: hypothetical protein WD751_01435 [Anaerolineales bacterium]